MAWDFWFDFLFSSPLETVKTDCAFPHNPGKPTQKFARVLMIDRIVIFLVKDIPLKTQKQMTSLPAFVPMDAFSGLRRRSTWWGCGGGAPNTATSSSVGGLVVVAKGGGGDAVDWVRLVASAVTGVPCSRWWHILYSARIIAPV